MAPGDNAPSRGAGEVVDVAGTNRRIILIYGSAPPTRGGTSFVVARVLPAMDRCTLDVWTRIAQRGAVRRGSFVLPGRYRYFPKLRNVPRAPRVISRLVTAANVCLGVATGLTIGCLARRDRAACIVSVVDEGFSQIAAAAAARVAGLPHVVWVFDPWEENAYAGSDRRVARFLEGRIWRSAAAVVVHAEELAAHYRSKHGVDSHVLPIAIDEYAGTRPGPGRAADGEHGEWEVLVAGSVYWAQAEALRRVAAAVRRVEGATLTVIGDPTLQTERIDADRYEAALSGPEFHARLQRAALLVLGLSFGTDHADVVKTATPARLPEYLASGVPVLVHAPAGSHVVRYVRRDDLAVVVEQPDVDAVIAAIEAIRADPSSSVRRAAHARDHVLNQHAASVVAKAFRELLDSVDDRSRPRRLRVLVDAAAVRTGGGGTFVVSQITALARRDEFDLVVVAAGDVASHLERLQGVQVRRPPRLPLPARLLWEHLILAQRPRGVDVLYCVGNFALPLARVPQVVTMQNALHFGTAARRVRRRLPWRARVRLGLESALARLSVRCAFAVVAVSQSLRSAIEEDVGLRPSVGTIASATPPLPPPVPPAPAAPYVVSVANDHPHKEWDALVALFAEHRDLPPLVAVGEFAPARRRHLEELAAGRVRFVGPIVDRVELARLYSAAACCVVHSRLESFGLTPLEALACGTPVIASDIPAHREVCEAHAAYYDPADMQALGQMVRDVVASPAANGRTRVLRLWTWDDNARELAGVLSAAAASHRLHDRP